MTEGGASRSLRLIASSLEYHAGGVGRPPADLVSVTVTLFNYGRFLEECLDSVKAQRHSSLELIVVDDCSTEASATMAALGWLSRYSDRFYQARLYRHVRNQGLAEARNTAFYRAASDFVFVMDADNMIYPRAIGRLYEVMASGAFAGAYTQLERFGDVHDLGVADVFSEEGFIAADGNYIDAMAMVSKEAWERVGGYAHIEDGWEDYDMWLKFLDHRLKMAFIPEILCRYRVHGSSMVRQQNIEALVSLQQRMIMRHPWLADALVGNFLRH